MFRKLIRRNEHLLPWKRKKKDPRFFDHVSCRISEKQTSSAKSWPIACFRCNKTENFIFSLKHRRRKVDLNTSEKWLVFVTIRHRKCHLYVQLSYTKISYLRKNTRLRKDAAFIFVRRKVQKIWYFHKTGTYKN